MGYLTIKNSSWVKTVFFKYYYQSLLHSKEFPYKSSIYKTINGC